MRHSRPPTSNGAGPVIALDIGGTSIRGGIVTEGSRPQIRLRRREATQAQTGGAAVLKRVLTMAAALQAEAPEVTGVAVASAGVIDPATGAVASATELMPGWAGIQIGAALRAELNLESTVLNDVHAHALGEFHLGAGEGSSSTLVVAVGTGLGGAFISGGELILGAGGLAGHVGHMHHAAAAGIACSCGRTGHLESVASGSGMTSRYAETRQHEEPAADDGAAVAALASEATGTARKTLVAAGAALGECLGSLANAWDPETIILSGSVTGAGEPWWEAVRSGYCSSAMDALQDRPVVLGSLGDDAPLLGAAALHRESDVAEERQR